VTFLRQNLNCIIKKKLISTDVLCCSFAWKIQGFLQKFPLKFILRGNKDVVLMKKFTVDFQRVEFPHLQQILKEKIPQRKARKKEIIISQIVTLQ
jgi:hypothetical protein